MIIDRGKGSKAQNEKKLVGNINKNHSFQGTNHMQKEVYPLHKLSDLGSGNSVVLN